MHGLIHWLAGAYAKKGITVNGVAPALIGDTKMLPGDSTELAKSRSSPGMVLTLSFRDQVVEEDMKHAICPLSYQPWAIDADK